jgi:hypothetical protein
MQFLFHSVIEQEGQTRYYNIYQIDDERYLAECHHFNRERSCEGDFELHKKGVEWVAAAPSFDSQAQIIGEEIERMSRDSEPV